MLGRWRVVCRVVSISSLPLASVVAALGACGTDTAASPPDAGPSIEAGVDAGPHVPADAGPQCGNGIIEGDEECDVGAADTPSCAHCQVPEHTLSTSRVSIDSNEPKVLASAQGYTVIWTTYADSHVVARQVNVSGLPSGPERQLDTDTTSNYPYWLNLGATADGFLATWEEGYPGERFRKLNAAGEPQGQRELDVPKEKILSDPFAFAPPLPTGGILSIIHYDYSQNMIRRTPVSSDGMPDPSSGITLRTMPEDRYADEFATASLPDGSTVLAWAEMAAYPARWRDPELHVDLLKDGKTIWSKSLGQERDSVNFSVAASNDGTILVAWMVGLSFDKTLRATWIAPDGTIGKIFDLPTDTWCDPPSVAYSTKGEFLAVWSGCSGLCGQRFTSHGDSIDQKPVSLVDDFGHARSPQVAADPDGKFFVVYKNNEDAESVRYRLFPHGFHKKR